MSSQVYGPMNFFFFLSNKAVKIEKSNLLHTNINYTFFFKEKFNKIRK